MIFTKTDWKEKPNCRATYHGTEEVKISFSSKTDTLILRNFFVIVKSGWIDHDKSIYHKKQKHHEMLKDDDQKDHHLIPFRSRGPRAA